MLLRPAPHNPGRCFLLLELRSHIFSTRQPESGIVDNGYFNSIKRLAALTFSTTIALATVLAELILCEISNSIDPAARGLALRYIYLLTDSRLPEYGNANSEATGLQSLFSSSYLLSLYPPSKSNRSYQRRAMITRVRIIGHLSPLS